jgi:hypothetical protein
MHYLYGFTIIRKSRYIVNVICYNPLPYNRRLLLFRLHCGPFDSSEKTLYNECVNTRNKIESTQVMYAVPLVWQHVSISEDHLQGR